MFTTEEWAQMDYETREYVQKLVKEKYNQEIDSSDYDSGGDTNGS